MCRLKVENIFSESKKKGKKKNKTIVLSKISGKNYECETSGRNSLSNVDGLGKQCKQKSCAARVHVNALTSLT